MASYQQMFYCRKCKKNVSVDEKGLCRSCHSSQIKKSWSVRFRIIDINGEIHKRLTGFNTKKEAEKAYIDFLANYIPFQPQKTYSLKFEEVFNNYLQTYKLENTESTIYDKKHIFDMYIIPYFKNKDITDISKVDLQNWQNFIWSMKSEKTNKKLSWKYLTKIRGHFYNFLEYCRNLYDIPNQLENIKIPKNIDIKKEIIFWELKDFDNFISNLDNNNIIWKTLWFTFMFTGCRFNEIRALKDDDISNNKISIKYSLSSKKTSNPNSRTATKNHKTYIKQIPDKLQLQIDLYKTWKKENNISGDFLFGGDNPLPEKTIRNHLIKDIQSANKKLSKDAKLKIITPHGFRHSYVSLLIHLGISTKIIAELIGDREEQVIKTYGHLYSGVKDAAIAMLNDKINQIL